MVFFFEMHVEKSDMNKTFSLCNNETSYKSFEMLNIKTSHGIFRRYLFWLKYDGSRFPEMATSPRGFGIMDTVHRCLEYLTYSSALLGNSIRISPSSR
jgi:hypothetical protein